MDSKVSIYISLNQKLNTNEKVLLLRDITKVWCEDPLKKKEVEKIPVYDFSNEKASKYAVIDMLYLMDRVYEYVKEAELINLGEKKLLVLYAPKKKENVYVNALKIILVCVLVFCGGAFSILAFNYDAGVTQIMNNIYEKVTGLKKSGISILEVMYSIGIVIGILVFYNRLQGRSMISDPTPIDIEMLQYEKNETDAVIDTIEKDLD